MGLFRRSRQNARGGHAAPKPTWRERLAARRTARAENARGETEQRIHEIAEEMRTDFGGPA